MYRVDGLVFSVDGLGCMAPGLWTKCVCVCLSVCPCAIGENRGRVRESDREILAGGVGFRV